MENSGSVIGQLPENDSNIIKHGILVSEPEYKLSSKTHEVPAVLNIKSKLQVFEKLIAAANSNSRPRILDVIPPGMTSVKDRLKAYEVIHTVSPDSNTCRPKTPVSSGIPSLKSRLNALHISKIKNVRNVEAH